MGNYEALKNLVISGDIQQIVAEVKALLDGGMKPAEIINQGLIAGMNIVGKKMKDGEMYVPEVLMAANAMKKGVEFLKPLLTEGEISAAGTVLMGTVKGDLHDIGKNLVIMMLESNGYQIVDLGIDVPAHRFVEAIKEHKPQIVGLSALLTTTLPAMQNTIEVIKEAGFKDTVKVIIGGAPVTEAFAIEIGADGYAADAASAVDLVKRLSA